MTGVHLDPKTKVLVGTDQMTLNPVSLYIAQAAKQEANEKQPRVVRGPLILRKNYAHKVLVVLASPGNGTLENVRVIGVMDEPEYP